MSDLNHKALIASFPDSVRTWLEDPKVYHAVNHLAGVKKDDLADGLQWEEFEAFLEARAMAHLTRAEYPIALFRYWDFVWGNSLDQGWQRESVDENGSELLGPQVSWNDGSMAVKFRKNGVTLHTLVGMDQHETTVGFSLEDEVQGDLINASAGAFEWHGPDTDWDRYMLAIWRGHSLTHEGFEWQNVIAARDEALLLVSKALA